VRRALLGFGCVVAVAVLAFGFVILGIGPA
jgi:hypothetical protein